MQTNSHTATERTGEISSVVVSYAFKLLIQEMMSLGLACRLRLQEMI